MGSDPENISTMKFLLAVVTLFTALTCVLAEPEPQLNYFYKSRAAVNGALGYPRAYGGYGGYSGYDGHPYGYGYRYHSFGKRSADAEPEAQTNYFYTPRRGTVGYPGYGYYSGYGGYNRGYYGGYRGYNWG